MRSNALWRVAPYVRPYRRHMVAMVVTALVGLGAGTLIPLVTRAVVDGPLARDEPAALVPLAALALALGLVEAFMAFLRRHVLATAAMGIETDLRNDLYRHLQSLPVSFHDEWQTGQLLSRATTDLSVLRRFIGFGTVFLIVNTATFAVVIALLVRIHPPLALLTALSAVPIVFLSMRFEQAYLAVSRKLQDDQGDLATSVEESATGIRIIKAFGRREAVAASFTSQALLVRASALDTVRVRGRFWSLLGLVPNLTLGAIVLLGGLAAGRGTLSLGDLVAFVLLLQTLVWPVQAMGWILATAQEAAAASQRIFEVLDTRPAIEDRPEARSLASVAGHVRFESVGFGYDDRGDVLRAIDLEIRPGETVALVGATGSGKTTLVSLVPRLHDATAGRVTIDGHDVRDIRLDCLRRHVGVAFEDPILFSASVRENLLLGHPQATEDDVEQALATAQAEFVHDLPWGLDTRVGEQGLSLSGGQRQRLALARAVIGRPQVLVLDDPLSALDVHTEALVEAALRRVLAGVTALVVVHRPSTVALADRVALLDDGTIAAVGTHSELMASNDRYRSILSMQAEDDDLEAGAVA